MTGVIEVLWLGILLPGLAGGPAGVVLFTATWFLVASGLEAVIAFAVACSGRMVWARGQAWFTAVSAVAFLCLAATLVARDVLPRLG